MAEEEKKVEQVELDKPVLEEINYKPPKRMSLHTKNSDDANLENISALEKMAALWGEMYEQILDDGGKCIVFMKRVNVTVEILYRRACNIRCIKT